MQPDERNRPASRRDATIVSAPRRDSKGHAEAKSRGGRRFRCMRRISASRVHRLDAKLTNVCARCRSRESLRSNRPPRYSACQPRKRALATRSHHRDGDCNNAAARRTRGNKRRELEPAIGVTISTVGASGCATAGTESARGDASPDSSAAVRTPGGTWSVGHAQLANVSIRIQAIQRTDHLDVPAVQHM